MIQTILSEDIDKYINYIIEVNLAKEESRVDMFHINLTAKLPKKAMTEIANMTKGGRIINNANRNGYNREDIDKYINHTIEINLVKSRVHVFHINLTV